MRTVTMKTSKNQMKITMMAIMSILFISSCNNDDDNGNSQPNASRNEPQQVSIDLGTHKLETYSQINDAEYLVVFESGLGYGAFEWFTTGIVDEIGDLSDVLLYDRAGYNNSEIGPGPRDIETLTSDLEMVVEPYLNGRKVILVCHSLGGLIARDYAIKNPDKVASILFIDPTHESFHNLNQAKEDFVYEIYVGLFGTENHGAPMEARELIEDDTYATTLTDLPNIPITVLTSMKQDQNNNDTDELHEGTRQTWYDAHEELGFGISDFTHISTVDSGHGINFEEPGLVIEHIKILLSK
ncbi:alpha/beta fold hydrolase [Flagellimonas flava]|nr:alpha/beta fold hydrolase [Allomuricauda flava]